MQEQTPSGFLGFFFFVSNFIQLGLIKHLRQRGTRLQVCNGWSLSLMSDLYFIKLCKACSPGGSDRLIFKWTDLFQITSVKLWTDYWINLSTKPWFRLYWETHETTQTHAHTHTRSSDKSIQSDHKDTKWPHAQISWADEHKHKV